MENNDNHDKLLIKNYKYWSGYNEFYCNGRLMLGPSGCKLLSITLTSINIPICLVYVFTILVSTFLFIEFRGFK